MTFLAASDPDWPGKAAAEAERWRAARMDGLLMIHHIGATAVPGLPARPVIDLMPVFADMAACDAARPIAESLGYDWLGDLGVSGRRMLRRDDAETGRRLAQAQCFGRGDPAIRRYLAFRDALRGNAPLRAAYTAERERCAARHPDGGPSYGRCKAAWIDRAEAIALERQS